MRKPTIFILVALVTVFLGLCLLVAGSAYLGLQMLRRSEPPAPVSSLPAVTQQAVPTPARSATATVPSGIDRLVVQGVDGNIYTMRRDGTERVALTDDASASRLYSQPTWSADAGRVAWVDLNAGPDGVASALLTSQPDGRARTRTDLAGFAPFYLFWRPDGQGVACLGNGADGLALRWVDVLGDGPAAVSLGQGSPFYFAWAPDSSRLLAHIDGSQLAFLSASGEQDPLADVAGEFNAPDWSRDGRRLVYALRSSTGLSQRLVAAEPDGGPVEELATVAGALSFVLDPGGKRLAYIVTNTPVPTAAFGPLSVLDLGSGEAQQVSAGPVLGAFWSPDGSRLAYLALGRERPAGPQAALLPTLETQHANVRLQWRVWDGAMDMALSEFTPSDTFLFDYLRFVDQYARSMTPWAPDGDALVFAAQDQAGSEAIWVQPVTPGVAAQRVTDGVYAAWSPR